MFCSLKFTKIRELKSDTAVVSIVFKLNKVPSQDMIPISTFPNNTI